MNVVVLTPVRVLGDGLVACFQQRCDVDVVAVVDDLAGLRSLLSSRKVAAVLIDVTQGVELYDVRSLVTEHPGVAFVALGLTELRHEVIRCGRAGFSGYVARNASVDDLAIALRGAVEGRLVCPSDISNGLLRALFCDSSKEVASWQELLTRRESEVLQLIGQALSNKEIARELCLSIATVKHHVHKVLQKLQLTRRTQAMHRIRDASGTIANTHATLASRLGDE